MALDQLDTFMQALGQLESGNDYSRVGPRHPTMGRARGRFQIMESNWSAWAADAGISGANWRDPAAQDRVAAHKMSQYYRQFGSWDLVAVAWFAGPGRAKKAAERGLSSVGQLKDSLGTSVTGYVQKVNNLMGTSSSGVQGPGHPTSPVGPSGESLPSPSASPSPSDVIAAGNHRITNPEDFDERPTFGPRQAAEVMFSAISNAKAGGQRTDYRTLNNPFPDLPQQQQLEEQQETGVGVNPEQGGVVEGGSTPTVSGLDTQFESRLNRLIADAPGSVTITSGFRSVERQQELWDEALKKYGSAAKARKWVAPPGKSQHNKGMAADLSYASDEVKRWVHANASKYGLHFPLSNEPWHVEMEGTRG